VNVNVGRDADVSEVPAASSSEQKLEIISGINPYCFLPSNSSLYSLSFCFFLPFLCCVTYHVLMSCLFY
jgi:hypothetical protein